MKGKIAHFWTFICLKLQSEATINTYSRFKKFEHEERDFVAHPAYRLESNYARDFDPVRVHKWSLVDRTPLRSFRKTKCVMNFIK